MGLRLHNRNYGGRGEAGGTLKHHFSVGTQTVKTITYLVMLQDYRDWVKTVPCRLGNDTETPSAKLGH